MSLPFQLGCLHTGCLQTDSRLESPPCQRSGNTPQTKPTVLGFRPELLCYLPTEKRFAAMFVGSCCCEFRKWAPAARAALLPNETSVALGNVPAHRGENGTIGSISHPIYRDWTDVRLPNGCLLKPVTCDAKYSFYYELEVFSSSRPAEAGS